MGASQTASSGSNGQKDISAWCKDQKQFAHLPQLAKEWIRVKSSSGSIYFVNIITGETSKDIKKAQGVQEEVPLPESTGLQPREQAPLPEPWTIVQSRSNPAKSYY